MALGADGKTWTVTATPEHPFMVAGKGWVEAGSLGVGTSIVTRAGPLMAVQSVQWQRQTGAEKASGVGGYAVYNFTVEGTHTYFVGDDNHAVLVHNEGCILRSKIGQSPYASRLAGRLRGEVQDDVDLLTSKLASGNRNPGIGTRALGDGFYELRGANQGRVIIKQVGEDIYDIVGKFEGHARGDSGNSSIIQNLLGGYVP